VKTGNLRVIALRDIMCHVAAVLERKAAFLSFFTHTTTSLLLLLPQLTMDSKHLCDSTYTMALTPRQYRSHILLNLGCPPMSHTFMTSHTKKWKNTTYSSYTVQKC